MGYIRKNIRKIIAEIDEHTMPSKWEEFIKKETKHHNLLIKKSGKCYCTHCGLDFKSKMRIGQKEKCPYCKQTLEIRNSTLKFYEFTKDIMLLDKAENKLVIRIFEVASNYHYIDKTFSHKAYEYGRIIIDENCRLVNERVKSSMWSSYVVHTPNAGKWRIFNSYYGLNSRSNLYPYNLKKILKGTRYEYSHLWDFIKKVTGCDLENLLTGSAKYPSFELLVKAKLYNLALEAKEYNKTGNFKERFGVDKEYYEFMKKNNINCEELEILSLIQKADIKLIKYLKSQLTRHERLEISKYIDLKKLDTYYKNTLDGRIYCDYLQFAQTLGMNMKDKKVLFPENLKEEHDKLQKQVKIIKNKKIKENIKKRYMELIKNKFEDKKYIIFPASSVEALKDESEQQNHCVRNYTERYSNALCDIYFMRLLTNKEKSLVTVEVRENKIVQKRIKDNALPNDEENMFLEKWQTRVLQRCSV